MINRYTFAGLLAVLAVVGLVALGVFVVNGAGDEPDRPADRAAVDTSAAPPTTSTATAAPTKQVTLPRQKTKALGRAAKLAGCTISDEPNEGAEHVTRDVTPADYAVNPPTSGMHAPVPAADGVYESGSTPELGALVHTLEHGRINIQYEPGTAARTVAQLELLYKELDKGYHLLLYENGTGMRFAIAATAWDHLLGCRRMNDRVFDAIRAFTAAYVDHGPETVP